MTAGPASLLLNGSPHHHGQTMALAEALHQGLGGDQAVFHLYDLDVRPCRDCGRCREGQPCSQTDDAMARVLATLAAAPVTIVASPVHFVSLTAPVVAFFSRLQPLWHSRGHHARLDGAVRQGALVLTGGSRYRDMFQPARGVTAAVFATLGIHFAGMAVAMDTDHLPVRDNAPALAGARSLGAAMRAAATG
ncbi:MAG: flavodoxin family protein [Planctomycetes bacterium]|nr:flavodoxin family protein [Planctomycetota bacterium]